MSALATLRDRLFGLADAFDAFAARRFAFAERDDRLALLLTLVLLGHVVVWTLQPLLAHNNLADSVDMVETWTWGREWQLGYWKHPPFYAWVTGAWFAVFPRADWAYYLLAAANAAVGLAGVFAMASVVDAAPRRRLLAVAGLTITPVWGFLALKFNANAILLAVWPWATWAFLRALARPTAVNGAVLGVLLAVAMLSKYVSLVLVAGMIVAILLDPRRLALLRSPAMIAAAIAGAITFAPHFAWMVATDFRTLSYAEHMAAESTGQFLNYLVRFPLSLLLFLLPMIAVTLVALPRADWRALLGVFAWKRSDAGRRGVLVMGLAPIATMALLGLWKFAKLSSQWGFPLTFPASWLLVSAPGLDDRRIRLDRVAAVLALAWTGLVVTAPLVNLVGTLAGGKVHVEPRAELAAAVTRVWHEASGGRPLAIVAGDFDLASNTAFYAADRPSTLIDFAFDRSPWLSMERIRAEGVAVVCAMDQVACHDAASSLLGADPHAREVTVAKRWFGITLKPVTYRVFLRLPEGAA